MARFNSPLNNLTIAAPCSANWDEMSGSEQVRFCSHCNLNVYNLSGMSKNEAESLIARTEGRLCVRFYQRTDGTILTRNCPVGLQAIRRRLRRTTTAITSAVLSFFAGLGVYTGLRENEIPTYPSTMGVRAISEATSPANSLEPEEMMGDVAVGQMVGKPEHSPKISRRSHQAQRNARR